MTTSLTRRTLLTGGGRESALRSVAAISEHCFAFTGVSCRSCEDACEPRAIRFRPQSGGHYHPKLDADICTGCGDCIAVCPAGAMTIEAARPAHV